jgi:hypothetical protein
MDVSLDLVLGFGITEKEGAQAEACAIKNKNASRWARRSTERENHTRIGIWYTRGTFCGKKRIVLASLPRSCGMYSQELGKMTHICGSAIEA